MHKSGCHTRSNKNIRTLTCKKCNKKFHSRCFRRQKNKMEYKNSNEWYCNLCAEPKLPKCSWCKKKLSKNHRDNHCQLCFKTFHKKCLQTTFCYSCSSKELPFCNIDDVVLGLTLEGKDNFAERINSYPSFSVKTLLDKFPGEIKIETDNFLSKGINSKYYSPAEFLKAKIEKSNFSVLHINIVSLSLHINELRGLLVALEHQFDAILISETKIQSNGPISNIEIEGYDFEFTPTSRLYGGVGIYIREDYVYSKIQEISKSIPGIGDSIFLEAKTSKKKILVGGLYRHHDESIKKFNDTMMSNILDYINGKNIPALIGGDFNINLLAID